MYKLADQGIDVMVVDAEIFDGKHGLSNFMKIEQFPWYCEKIGIEIGP